MTSNESPASVAPPELSPHSPELEDWAATVRTDVARLGLEAALINHGPKIATCALDCPQDLERFVVGWMHQDPNMRRRLPDLPEGKDINKVSYRDARALRHAKHIFNPSSSSSSSEEEEEDELSFIERIKEKKKRKKAKLRIPGPPIKGVNEASGKPVTVFHDKLFRNWGHTVESRPKFTFEPRSVAGIKNIVQFAKREGYRVRVVGSSHSWSPVYGKDGEVLIALTSYKFAAGGALHPPNPQDIELEEVKFVRELKNETGVVTGALVRLGAAAASDHFREWTSRKGPTGGNSRWAPRALPILVEITTGGNIQAICHGSGITSQSTSDLVHEVEFVNARGELQIVNDPMQLQAAAGCLGLLGVVTAITLRVEPLTYANFFPEKVPTPLAVPPVTLEDIPKDQSDFSADGLTKDQLESATEKVYEDAHKFYSEWFWFPFQSECWLNNWDNDAKPDPSGAIYPDEKEVRKQNKQAALGHAFESTLLRFVPARCQAELTAKTAMALLPAGEPLPTPVPEALHFRRGIHRMPVKDMEVEIPLPGRADDPSKPDFTIAQKAWWMAIQEVYAQLPSVPMRTTLEMRIIGGSNMIMSPHRGNDLGTCSIEVLTSSITDESEWNDFKQAVLNRWASLKDPVSGKPLKIRPHWAKEWEGMSIRGMPVTKYFKTIAYDAEIPLFKQRMSEVATSGGYDLSESFEMFGNDTLLDILSV